MKIVFDNNVPVGLARLLTGHTVSTSPDLGWTTLRNGVLLANAEAAGFEVLVTADQNIAYQQNLTGRKIALVVLGSNSWPVVRESAERILGAVNQAFPGSFQFIEMPATIR